MDYYKEIKSELLDVAIHKKVNEYYENKYELEKYYNVGKLLVEAQRGSDRAKYGNGLIKEYANKLAVEIDKKYDERTLRRMRQFYLTFNNENWSTMSTTLSWSHYCELLPLKEINAINYYIYISIREHLGVRQLRERIKNHEYERLSESTKNKLIQHEELTIKDDIKNPIIIKNTSNEEIDEIGEKLLKQMVIKDITNFMHQLGTGYAFIDNEYKIKVGDRYNYIDMLLFNIEYNCYVVVEFKVNELDKKDIGQLLIYMGYIDNNLRKITQNKTIGIIVMKKNNEYIIKYSSNEHIIGITYELV